MRNWLVRRVMGYPCMALPLAVCAMSCSSSRSMFGDLEQSESELVSGAINVSDGLVTESDDESNTAAVAMGNFLAVAYNIFYVPDPENRAAGISQIGMSYFNGPNPSAPTWRAVHFATPTSQGIAALRYTPSIAFRDYDPPFTDYSVWVSLVAYSQAVWPGYPATISYDTYKNISADKICVVSLTIPKSGAAANVRVTSCFGETGAKYVGTAMSSPGLYPYVASWNAATQSISVFGLDGTPQANPFPGRAIVGSPIYVKNDPSSIIAPDSGGSFWMASFNTSNLTWSPAVAVGPTRSPTTGLCGGIACFQWGSSLPAGVGGTAEYAAVYVPSVGGPGTTYLFYRSGTKLVGWARTVTTGPNQVFTSRAGFDAFHPAVEVATVSNEFPPYPGFHPMLTYLDNSGLYGTIVVNSTWPGRPLTTMGGSQVPCPVKAYWGITDEMAIRNNSTSAPEYWRFFTDSTHTTVCDTAAEEFHHDGSTPQHVSAFATTARP